MDCPATEAYLIIFRVDRGIGLAIVPRLIKGSGLRPKAFVIIG